MSASATIIRMNVALRKPMTHEEFFSWAEAQEGRYEFDGVQPIAMTGGTNNHGFIADNLRAALRTRLRGGPCRSMGTDGGGVATTGKKIRYPEATITCTRVPGETRLIPEPVVVFEVLSPSTRREDEHDKLAEFMTVPSIRRYVLIEQIRMQLVVHTRQADGSWINSQIGAAGLLELPEVGINLPVAEIYEDIEFNSKDG